MKTAIPVLFLIFVFLFGCGESDVTIEDSNGDPDAFEENTDSEISDWTNPGDEESANGDFDADIAENPENRRKRGERHRMGCRQRHGRPRGNRG